jgi:hypothetical protein
VLPEIIIRPSVLMEIAMARGTARRPRLPGTLEGLVELAGQAIELVDVQNDALAEISGLLARIERYLEGEGGDEFVLLLDTREGLRRAGSVREGTRPWLMRLGAR